MSRFDHPVVLDELKSIWKEKSQLSIKSYQEALKNETFDLFVDKSQKL
jgi:hypothetical protein